MVVARRIAAHAIAIGAIDNNQLASRAQRSVQDALLRQLTPAQDWLLTPTKTGQPPPPLTRPTLLANDIEGALNTVRNNRLVNVMERSGFPKYLSAWVKDFCTNSLSFHFEEMSEQPKPFESGLPQGSPLSPVLFVVYSGPTIRPSTQPKEKDSIYVDDDTMLQGSSCNKFAVKRLQEPLEERITRARPLALSYAPSKAELTHLLPTTSSRPPSSSPSTILLHDHPLT